MASTDSPADTQAGVQSLEVGIELFARLHRMGRAASLSELSEAAGMHPSKAHRYLVSLVRTGLVERTGRGSYRLGPFAVQIAHSGVLQDRALRIASERLMPLAKAIDEMLILTSWGVHAPYLVKVVESSRPFAVRPASHGELPLWNSATSRVFLACMPRQRAERLIDAEIARDRAAGVSKAEATRRRSLVLEQMDLARRHGVARTTGERQPGLVSFAAPIFDSTGQVVLVVAAVGLEASMPANWNGPVPKALLSFAAAVSAELAVPPSE